MTAASTEHLSEGLRCLIREIEACDDLTPARTRQLLQGASIDAEDLAAWADYNHPAPDAYGRKMLHDGGCFELMVMSWQPGDMSALHDHGFTQWGAVRLFGDAEHAMFKVSDGKLQTVERTIYPSGSVVAVNHDLVHQMGNIGDQPFLSLHLYGCYQREGAVTAEARLYELDRGVVQRTSGGVFFDLPSSAILCTEPGPTPDFPTYLRHQVELLRRLNRADEHGAASPESLDRRLRLIDELFSAATWQRGVEAYDDLDSTSPVGERQLDIFIQELRAAARLQAGLRRRDLGHGVDAEVLDGLLSMASNDFAEGYWRHLASTLDVGLSVLN